MRCCEDDGGLTGLAPGAPQVTMATDSVFRLEGRMRDLRDLFQTFVDASCTTRFTDAEEAKAMELRTVMGLSPREAEDMITTTKSNAYKDMLREAYVSGALEKAASKAEALQDICDAVNFDSEAALQIKIGIYRQRVEQVGGAGCAFGGRRIRPCLEYLLGPTRGRVAALCVARPSDLPSHALPRAQVVESGSVSDATAAELDKLRVLFCIEDQYVESIERETKGREFLRVVQDAFNAGVDGFRCGVAGGTGAVHAACAAPGPQLRRVWGTRGQSAALMPLRASPPPQRCRGGDGACREGPAPRPRQAGGRAAQGGGAQHADEVRDGLSRARQQARPGQGTQEDGLLQQCRAGAAAGRGQGARVGEAGPGGGGEGGPGERGVGEDRPGDAAGEREAAAAGARGGQDPGGDRQGGGGGGEA